jgi:hypothetical protein
MAYLPLDSFHNSGETMKEATFKDAMRIADALNLDAYGVWELIKGRKYSEKAELELMVCYVIAQSAPEEMDAL